MRARERLDAVREGIEPRAGGDGLRHADRQFGITDNHAGQHLGMEDDLLFPGLRIGDHRSPPDLGSGPRRRRHGDDRIDPCRIGPRPPVADILEIPDRTRLAGHEGQRLCQIEARAAAEGDDPVITPVAIGAQPLGHIGIARIRVDLRENCAAKAGLLHQIQHPGCDLHRREPPVGDEERLGDTRLTTGLGEFRDASGAEADGGRQRPVCGEAH